MNFFVSRRLCAPIQQCGKATFFLFLAIYFSAKKLRKEGFNFDLVDGHYFYPDGVSIAAACKFLKRPFTLTARGTDLSLIAQIPLPRKMICWASNKAAHLITVCEALREVLLEMGQSQENVTTLRNGVDLKLFHLPCDEIPLASISPT